MSCCNSLSNITTSCGGAAGGIKRIYFTCWNSGLAQNYNATSNNIGGFPTGTCWQTIDFFKETGSMETEGQFIDNHFVSYYTTTISLQLQKIDNPKILSIGQIEYSELAIIVLDNNGNYWFYGVDYPVIATAVGATTGTAYTDQNGLTLTFTATDMNLPASVSSSAITTC